jgi:hypothetical protein
MQLTVGIPSAHALGWAMVAVDCSLARALRFFELFRGLGFPVSTASPRSHPPQLTQAVRLLFREIYD